MRDRAARPKTTRILIAGAGESARSSLISILGAREDWVIVGEARDGRQAVGMAVEKKPDVWIIDFALPVMNGAEVARQIRVKRPDTEVLILTEQDSDLITFQALEAGAKSILLKSDVMEHLISAVEALAQHRSYFTKEVSEKLVESFLSSRKRRQDEVLSPRERVVVQLIAEGNTNRQIATMLNVSVKTVETQRAAAMKKLNLTSTAGIVRYAIRNRIIEP